MNSWKATLYPKRCVEATGYLLKSLCIRLNPLIIQGVNTVAAEAVPVIRCEWRQ